MRPPSDRYYILYNGEVYNFQQLRRELEHRGTRFRGHSDTEVMLAAIDEWGLWVAIERFVGMFAFACWDAKERILHLGRDRMKEKPLYYGWIGRTFVFASELKALRAHPNWCADIDRDALVLHMRYGYVPAPYSIHKNVYKLLPGTVLSIGATSSVARGSFLHLLSRRIDLASNLIRIGLRNT